MLVVVMLSGEAWGFWDFSIRESLEYSVFEMRFYVDWRFRKSTWKMRS